MLARASLPLVIILSFTTYIQISAGRRVLRLRAARTWVNVGSVGETLGRISRHPTEPKRGCPSSPVSFSRTRHAPTICFALKGDFKVKHMTSSAIFLYHKSISNGPCHLLLKTCHIGFLVMWRREEEERVCSCYSREKPPLHKNQETRNNQKHCWRTSCCY